MKIKELKKKVRKEADNIEINEMSNVVKAHANDASYEQKSSYHYSFGRKEIVTLVSCSLSIVLVILFSIFIIPRIGNSIEMSREVARPLRNASTVEKIKKESQRSNKSFSLSDINFGFGGKASMNGADMAPENSNSMDSMSGTISQVEGIQEGEIVKLDENHIYYIYLDSLQIYTIENNKASLTKEIKLSNCFYSRYDNQEVIDEYAYYAPVQMYVTDENLIIITEQAVQKNEHRYYSYFYAHTFNTIVTIYEKEEFNCVKEIVTPGKLVDGRVYGDCLYFVSCELVEDDKIHSVNETNNGVNKSIEFSYDDVLYVPAYASIYEDYICSVNLKTLESNYECQLGESNFATIYMSTNALYLCATKYIDDEANTLIYKYVIDENKNLKYSSCGCVKGIVLNQYSIDEYNGYLRIAVYSVAQSNLFKTNYVNAVYVLEEQKVNNGKVLVEVGKLDECIGYPGERIKSVKFNGEYVSIVTYRTTDPLYLIKFTDDTKIEIVDYLKAPGYSSYLLDVIVKDNNYKLGVGYTDGRDYKVSLYTEENEEVKQIGEDYVIKHYNYNSKNDIYSYVITTAVNDIRTMFLYQDKYDNLFIGMNLDYYYEYRSNDEWVTDKKGAYLVLKINPESEVISKAIEFETSSISSRLVAIGDYYYVVSNKQVLNYKYNVDTNTFEELE